MQRIRLESRSAFGLSWTAWGAGIEGTRSWGNARQGYFLAPSQGTRVQVKAWPGFRQELSLQAITPDLVPELRSVGEAEAFRTWFVALLEQQLEALSPAWEPAQRDCAGLLRFAFREAWGPHTEAWRSRVGFRGPSVAPEPGRELGGPWRRAFPTPDGWAPFARGLYLRTLACEPLGRDPSLARPGDLAFFARGGAHPQPDHAMAFVRPDADGQPMLLYHTGPEGLGQAGEVRRVRLDELDHHPDPAFRPHPENPAFLGVYRWKVLADSTSLPRVSFQSGCEPRRVQPPDPARLQTPLGAWLSPYRRAKGSARRDAASSSSSIGPLSPSSLSLPRLGGALCAATPHFENRT